MKPFFGPVVVFFLLQMLAMTVALSISGRPYISEFRPEIVSEQPQTSDIFSIFNIVLVGTVVLIALKYLRFRMKYLVDFAVLVSSYYLAGIYTNLLLPSLLFAFIVLAIRQGGSLLFYNASSAVSIVSFSLLFGLFLKPELVLLLLAVMSVYDVIGVLYTKHIKYIWFGMAKRAADFDPSRWREAIAVIFPQEGGSFMMVGAGDFALPALLTVSLAGSSVLAGVVSLIMSTVGFLVLQKMASMTKQAADTGLPGIPVLAFFSAIALLLSKAFGLAA